MIMTCNDAIEVEKLQDELDIRFDIKKLREPHHFLSSEVQTWKAVSFFLEKVVPRSLLNDLG